MNALSWTVIAISLTILAGSRWHLVRRKSALNCALHEIRRPLQTLALLSPAESGPGLVVPARARYSGATYPDHRSTLAEPVLQAMTAVGDLDRQLNGGRPPGGKSELVAARLMADGCVRRWQSRAALAGGRIELLWSGPDVLVRGDGVTLAAALENVIVNAIEHGGPDIRVTGRPVGKRVRIEVVDNGIAGRSPERGRAPAGAMARTRRRGSHGHGLVVAERTACEHGGRLETEFSSDGSRVTVILPQAGRGAGSSAAVKVNW